MMDDLADHFMWFWHNATALRLDMVRQIEPRGASGVWILSGSTSAGYWEWSSSARPRRLATAEDEMLIALAMGGGLAVKVFAGGEVAVRREGKWFRGTSLPPDLQPAAAVIVDGNSSEGVRPAQQ